VILTRTPFRVSFVGGGSDLPAYYERRAGAVLSTTINRYMYVQSHPFFEPNQVRLKYAQTETVAGLSEIQHPLFRTVLEKYGLPLGREWSSIADVPAGTGMGSSSSFTVGLLHNVLAQLGRADEATKAHLAEMACRVELEDLGEPIGKQDQYAAAYGGLNVFRFLPDGTVQADPVDLGPEGRAELESHLVLYYTGDQRSASAILAEQSKRTASEQDKQRVLDQMVDLVDPLAAALRGGRWSEMGHLLHENWQLKQSLASGITNPNLQSLYATALANGATGGKLLGAGGGGFLLFSCPPSQQPKLTQALGSIRPFPFALETDGSKVLYADSENG
jgi:D-glycero-alpha-D-manno-heptose-7-phosphate kinase